MTQNTKEYLIKLIASVVSIGLLAILGVYLFEIVQGQHALPATFQTSFYNFLGIFLLGLGSYVQWWFAERRAAERSQNLTNELRVSTDQVQQAQKEVQQGIGQVNYKLENGIKADQREIKEQVALLVERVPDERQVGGQRLSDPPCADLSPEGGIRHQQDELSEVGKAELDEPPV